LLKGGMGKPSVTVNEGFYSREEFIRSYSEKSGRDVSQIDFYLTFAYFKLAVIVQDRKSTRLNSSHVKISYAVFCLKKKKTELPLRSPASYYFRILRSAEPARFLPQSLLLSYIFLFHKSTGLASPCVAAYCSTRCIS